MRIAINKICVLMFLLAMLTSCGQKAPLFLPGDPAAVQSDVPGQYESRPSPDDSEDEADDEADDDRQ